MLDYDDLADPWSLLQRRRLPAAQPGQARPQVEPLAPEEESSLLGKIAGAGLGGIGYAGSVLEKTFGGRAIRGLLGGKPRELLSVLPGSDTLGITDEADRVSGRELLRNAGVAGDEDTWGNFAAGMGVELLTDPGMYMSFGGGALTKAGQVAKRAGLLPETVAGRVGTTLNALHDVGPPTAELSGALAASGKTLAQIGHEPLGYSVGFGLPLKAPSFGLGQSGIDAANAVKGGAQMLDQGLRKVPLLGHAYGAQADLVGKGLDAAGRYGRALFDPKVMGATDHLGQEVATEASAGVRPLMAQYRQKASQYADQLAAAGVDPTGEILRAVGEGTHTGPVHPAVEGVAKAMRSDLDEMLGKLQGMGVNVQQLADLEADYLPRYATPLAKPTGGAWLGRGRQPLVASDPRVEGRLDFLKNVPGGTGALNRLATDAAVHEGTPLSASALVREKYLGWDAARQAEHTRINSLPAEAFEAKGFAPGSPEWDAALQLRQQKADMVRQFKQGEELSSWARGLDPQFAASGRPGANAAGDLKFFGNHPLADYQSYFDRAARLHGAADATQGLFARSAVEGGGDGLIPLTQALERAGLKTPAGASPGGQAEALNRINALRQGAGGQAVADVLQQYVPEQSVKAATRYMQGFTTPEAVSKLGGAFDTLTSLTKAGQTGIWPAFHVRNFMSGMWNNWVKGQGEAPGGFVKAVKDAYQLARGGVVEDAHLIPDFAARGLTAEQATRELAREGYAQGIGGHLASITREAQGPGGTGVNMGTDLASFRGRVLGTQPAPSVAEMAKTAVGRAEGQQVSWKPWDIAGGAANADLFPPVAAGRQVGDLVENVNRNSLYVSLRRQGYSAEAAAKEVLGAHFDYTAAAKTDFEKTVMSRLVPFYTYARHNLPLTLEQLAQTPGGAAGTVARVAHDMRQDAGFLPDYLGSGLAIPTGDEEGGTRRYLTRLDLPPEQAFEMLKGGPRGVQNSLMGALGQVNPIIKAPLEYATGKQFFTGRDLGDLYSMTGSVGLDQLLSNSPLSRTLTTARTLADERKWQDPLAALAIPLNLGTGAKVTDVDMNKQREVAAREYIKDMLQGQPEISRFETIVPKAGSEAMLTEEERNLLRLNKTIEQRAKERKKK